MSEHLTLLSLCQVASDSIRQLVVTPLSPCRVASDSIYSSLLSRALAQAISATASRPGQRSSPPYGCHASEDSATSDTRRDCCRALQATSIRSSHGQRKQQQQRENGVMMSLCCYFLVLVIISAVATLCDVRSRLLLMCASLRRMKR